MQVSSSPDIWVIWEVEALSYPGGGGGSPSHSGDLEPPKPICSLHHHLASHFLLSAWKHHCWEHPVWCLYLLPAISTTHLCPFTLVFGAPSIEWSFISAPYFLYCICSLYMFTERGFSPLCHVMTTSVTSCRPVLHFLRWLYPTFSFEHCA